MINKVKNTISRFVAESKTEVKETKELTRLIWVSKDRPLTKEEIDPLKGQSLDIFRFICLSGIFVLPFSGFLIFFIIKIGKRLGVRILPSAFEEKK